MQPLLLLVEDGFITQYAIPQGSRLTLHRNIIILLFVHSFGLQQWIAMEISYLLDPSSHQTILPYDDNHYQSFSHKQGGQRMELLRKITGEKKRTCMESFCKIKKQMVNHSLTLFASSSLDLEQKPQIKGKGQGLPQCNGNLLWRKGLKI